MPELMSFQGKTECINIPQEIGLQWRVVGTILLDDKTGNIIPAIARENRDNAFDINYEILARWLQGQGIADTSWRGLLGVLKVHCPALAESIEEALMEEATDSEPGKWLHTQHRAQPLAACTHTPAHILTTRSYAAG